MGTTIPVSLDYGDLELLDSILSSKPPISVTSLSRLLNKSKTYVSKKLRKLERKGFKFTVDLDYWAIGLKLVITIASGHQNMDNISKRFLHSATRLIPNSIFTSYYKPVKDSYGFPSNSKLSGYEDYIEADKVYGSRPDFSKHFDTVKSRIILDKKQIIDEITGVLDDSTSVIAEIRNIERMKNAGRAKITEMDIKIASLLEEYGIISPNTIAEKLGLRKSRVLRRLSIISRYTKSISLSRLPWSKSLPLVIVSSLKTPKLGYAERIVSIISKHPLHKKTFLSTMTGEFITMFYADSKIAEFLAELFNELSMKGYVNYYMTWATTNTSWREYRLVEGPRYSKYTGTWINDMEKNKDVFAKS